MDWDAYKETKNERGQLEIKYMTELKTKSIEELEDPIEAILKKWRKKIKRNKTSDRRDKSIGT